MKTAACRHLFSSEVTITTTDTAAPGMTIVQRTPSAPQAAARPWPKFPLLKATTPFSFSADDSVSTRFIAPRILNEPAVCRCSSSERGQKACGLREQRLDFSPGGTLP